MILLIIQFQCVFCFFFGWGFSSLNFFKIPNELKIRTYRSINIYLTWLLLIIRVTKKLKNYGTIIGIN